MSEPRDHPGSEPEHEPTPRRDPIEPDALEHQPPEGPSMLSIPPHDGGAYKRGWTRAELADEMREQ